MDLSSPPRFRTFTTIALALAAIVAMALVYACAGAGSQSSSAGGGDLELELAGEWVLLFPNPLTLTGQVTMNGEEVDDPSVTWDFIAGPGDVEFSANALTTEATFSVPGSYRLRVSVQVDSSRTQRDVMVEVVAPQASYFVSPDGSDSNDGRSVTSPFATLQRAASVVRPGDVVMLREGVYQEYNTSDSWRRSGEPDRPIVIRNYPGETPIIDGSHRTRSPNSTNPSGPELIKLVGLDWYVFEGLVLRNGIGRGLDLQGDHHVVRYVVTHSNHGDGIFLRGSDNVVEDSVSYDNFSRSNGGESADGLKIDRGDSNVVRRVVAYENSDDGFDLWGSTNTLIEHSVAYANGRGPEGNGNGFKLSRPGLDSHNVARLNVSYSNRAHNFTDNGGGAIQVYNNTSFDAGDFGFVVRTREDEERSLIANNISFEDENGVLVDVQSGDGARPESHNNSWNLRIRDPVFVSTDPDDSSFLRLSEDSPAIDAGFDFDLPYYGDGVDLGAYEYYPFGQG